MKKQVRIKKEKWKRYLGKTTADSYEEYKCERVKTKKLIMKAKEKAWEEFGRKIEVDAKGNQKILYKVLKNVRNSNKEECLRIKDEKDQIITADEEVMERWRRYFEGLLSDGGNVDVGTEIIHDAIWEGDKITKEEIEMAMDGLKNGKATRD